MLAFVRINDDDGLLQRFSKLFSEYINIELPINYFRQGDTYFVYNKLDDTIVGGYTIIYLPPFRFMRLLPKQADFAQNFLKEQPLNDLYEVNGFFIKNPAFKVKIFEKLASDSLKLNRKNLLLFYDLDNIKLHYTWQKKLQPVQLYTGEPNTEYGNLQSHKNIYFGYVSREKIIKFLAQLKSDSDWNF